MKFRLSISLTPLLLASLLGASLLVTAHPAAAIPLLKSAPATDKTLTTNASTQAVVQVQGHISYEKVTGQGVGNFYYSWPTHDTSHPDCDNT